jgi:hypothetical protein
LNSDQINNPFSSNISIDPEAEYTSKAQAETMAIQVDPTKNEDMATRHPLKLKKIDIKAPKVAESWNEKRSYRGKGVIRIESIKCESQRDRFWQKNDYIQASG